MNDKEPQPSDEDSYSHGKAIDIEWYRKIRQKYKERVSKTEGVDINEEPDGIIFSVSEINALLSQKPDEVVVYFGVVKTVDADKKEYDRLTAILVGRKDGKDQLPSDNTAFRLVENGTQCCPPKTLSFIREV